MVSHRDQLLAMAIMLISLTAGSCLAQTSVHLDSPAKVTFSGERFAFRVDVMGTGNPTLVRHFAGAEPMAAFVTLKAKPPVAFVVGPEIQKAIKNPDHSVPCGETSAKVTFYFALDQKNQRALFINLAPGDGVLLDCQLQGSIKAIDLGEPERTGAPPRSDSLKTQ